MTPRAALAQGLAETVRLVFGLVPRLTAPGPAAIRLSFLAAPLCLGLLAFSRWVDLRDAPLPAPVWHMVLVQALLFAIGWAGFLLLAHEVLRRTGRLVIWPALLTVWNWCNLAQALVQFAADQSRLVPLPTLLPPIILLVTVFWQIWIEWRALRHVLTSLLLAAGLLAADVALGIFLQSLATTLGG